ncbi:hypothetical protein BLA29_013127, partial [Euroglyphus maynei]
MLTKVVFVLATVAIAYGQFLQHGHQSNVRYVPVGLGGAIAHQPQYVIAGGAYPATAGLQFLRQPQSVQYVAAAQPQTVQY